MAARETLYGLTDSDLAKLRLLVQSVERPDGNPLPQPGRRKTVPSRIIIGILGSAITGTTALTGKPNVGSLSIYSFSSTGIEATGLSESVYNFSLHQAVNDRWTVAERDSFTGKYIITTQFCS